MPQGIPLNSDGRYRGATGGVGSRLLGGRRRS